MTLLQRRPAEPVTIERGPTACLLIHGFAGSPAEIRPLVEYLAANGITVRAPLLPGHGTHPDDLRRTHWPAWVRAAEAELVVLRERYGTVHVVGFSMGGLVALYLAAHREVASVTTLSTPAKLADWREILVPLARQLGSSDRHPTDSIHSLVRLAKQVRKDLHRVTAPLLTIQGERDKWIAPESADYIRLHASSRVKDGILLPGRDHLIVLEQGRDEVCRAVHGWVARHAGQS